MESTFESNGATLQVSLQGDLIGGADALIFNKSFRDALQDVNDLEEVVINVSGVDFVNSSGLGMLLAARQSAAESGAKLKLEEPGEQLRGLLEITKLIDILGASGTASTSGL